MLFFGFVHFWTVEANAVGKHGVFCQVSEPNHHRVLSASSNVLHVHIWRLFFCLPPCKHYSPLQRQTIITPLPLCGLWLTQGRYCQLAGTDWKIGFCPALGPLGTMVWSSEHQGRCKTALQASAHEHLGSLGTSVHVEIGDTL